MVPVLDAQDTGTQHSDGQGQRLNHGDCSQSVHPGVAAITLVEQDNATDKIRLTRLETYDFDGDGSAYITRQSEVKMEVQVSLVAFNYAAGEAVVSVDLIHEKQKHEALL